MGLSFWPVSSSLLIYVIVKETGSRGYISKKNENCLSKAAISSFGAQILMESKEFDHMRAGFAVMQTSVHIATNMSIQYIAERVLETEIGKNVLEKSGYNTLPSFMKTVIQESSLFVIGLSAQLAVNSLIINKIDSEHVD